MKILCFSFLVRVLDGGGAVGWGGGVVGVGVPPLSPGTSAKVCGHLTMSGQGPRVLGVPAAIWYVLFMISVSMGLIWFGYIFDDF